MKNSRFLLIPIVGLFMLTSCQHYVDSPAEVVLEHSFSVMASLPPMDQETETKGYLGSYISANWTKDDKVSVVNLTTGKILAGDLTADRNGTSAKFTGTVTGLIKAGDVVALFYPSFNVSVETDFNTRVVGLAEQNSLSVPLVAYSTFTADGTSGQFTGLEMKFYYVLSYLKINIANLPESAVVSRIMLRNMPSSMSLSINSEKTDFVLGTDEEKAQKGKIVINGPFQSSESGTMTVAAGVMPSDESTSRVVVATIDGSGDYMASLSSVKLESHKYYNTVTSRFELVSLPGAEDYGIYDLAKRKAVDAYKEFATTLITGTEDGKCDFTMFKESSNGFWTLRDIPEDAHEGTKFKATANSYGINWLNIAEFDDAQVKLIEPDGDYSKLWIKSKDMLFIVRK